MTYSVDFRKLSLNEYREILRNHNLLPGRRTLHENLEANFLSLEKVGINNLEELTKALSAVPKLKALAQKAGISEDYLVLLKRESGSLQPKPSPLKDFPGIPLSVIEALSDAGIKTSKDYYELFTATDRYNEFLKALPLPESWGNELYSLCCLVRINGIGAAAARCFYEAGFISISDIAEAEAEDMLVKVSRANSENKYYKAKLGAKDMQFCIDCAKMLARLS